MRFSFILDDYVNGFDIFFEIWRHITSDHVLPSISHLFIALRLLALEKQSEGV